MALTKEQGEELVRLARSTVDAFVRGEDIANPEAWTEPFLREARGTFVTLKELDGELRGCIGFPYPVKQLGEAVVEAAISASAYDPRFPKVEPREASTGCWSRSALSRSQKGCNTARPRSCQSRFASASTGSSSPRPARAASSCLRWLPSTTSLRRTSFRRRALRRDCPLTPGSQTR